MSRLMHIIACVRTSFYDQIIFHFMHIAHYFISSNPNRQLGCSELSIMNTAAMNIHAQISAQVSLILWCWYLHVALLGYVVVLH